MLFNNMKKIDVVAGIIHNNGKIIIAKKSEKHKIIPRKWEFPGGKVEEGESHEAALMRELLEEMKLKVKVEKFLIKCVHSYDGENEIHLHAYLCKPLNSIKVLEHEKILWVNPLDLENYDLALIDKEVASNLIIGGIN